MKLWWRRDWYRFMPLGTLRSIRRCRWDIARGFYASAFQFENATLKVAGIVDKALATLDKGAVFQKRRHSQTSPIHEALPPLTISRPRFRIISYESDESYLIVAFPFCPSDTRQYLVGHILRRIIEDSGGGGLVYERLVYEKALTYSIECHYNRFSGFGYLDICGWIPTNNVVIVIKELLGTLGRLATGGISRDDLDATVRRVSYEIHQAKESPDAAIGLFSGALPLGCHEEILELVDSLTCEEVEATAGKIFGSCLPSFILFSPVGSDLVRQAVAQ